jgi:hypothetical protein
MEWFDRLVKRTEMYQSSLVLLGELAAHVRLQNASISDLMGENVKYQAMLRDKSRIIDEQAITIGTLNLRVYDLEQPLPLEDVTKFEFPDDVIASRQPWPRLELANGGKMPTIKTKKTTKKVTKKIVVDKFPVKGSKVRRVVAKKAPKKSKRM